MENHLLLECVGYLASLLIALSLMMSSILRLRIINSLGAITFVVYGLAIHAYPVAFLNTLILVVNVWHLRRMLHTREFFEILEVPGDSTYLRHFLHFHRAEIEPLLAEATQSAAADALALFILRDCVPAGVLLAREESPGSLRILLDFVIPGYRDLKAGRYLFREKADFFRARGLREIRVAGGSPTFDAYLRRIGFVNQPRAGASEFRLTL